MQFLSSRVRVLAVVQLCVCMMLGVAYAAMLPLGAPLWPLAAFLALTAALVTAGYFWIVRPYKRLERMIELFLEGYTLSSIDSEDGVSFSRAADLLVQRIREEFGASHLLKLSKRQAQYRALQNQINPHFLYNTLESIRSEALIAGLSSVAEMTEALAVFFRYTISRVENLVTVEEELQNCQTYFRIQQYRFGDRLQLEIRCAPEDRHDIYHCRLPKLTLQPILENSIIHGTEAKVGTGHLVIALERTENRLLIEVSDDGVGMDEITLGRLNDKLGKSSRAFQEPEDARTGSVALVNVNNRIHLLFGEEYGLHVYSMAGAGTDVQIALPMITSGREVLGQGVPL